MGIKERLIKLKSRMELDSGPETDNAKRLFERLLKDNVIPYEELEEKTYHHIPCHSGMQKALLILAAFLKIDMCYMGNNRSKMYLHANTAEFLVFNECLEQLKKYYNTLYKEAMRKIKSEVLGFAVASYPIKVEENDDRDGKKSRALDIDWEAFNEGKNKSNTLLIDKRK